MVQVSPEELRNFAGALKPADFSRIDEAGLAPNLGAMGQCGAPQGLLNQWAPHMTGFGQDLLRGIEGCRTVAHGAADRFEVTDDDSGRAQAILDEQLSVVREDRRPTQLGDLPRAPQDPQAPVDQPDLPSRPEDLA